MNDFCQSTSRITSVSPQLIAICEQHRMPQPALSSAADQPHREKARLPLGRDTKTKRKRSCGITFDRSQCVPVRFAFVTRTASRRNQLSLLFVMLLATKLNQKSIDIRGTCMTTDKFEIQFVNLYSRFDTSRNCTTTTQKKRKTRELKFHKTLA